MKTQKKTDEDNKNGTVTGQSKVTVPPSRASKTHQDYWKSRIVRRPFVTKAGKRGVPPEFSVRMRHLGRDVWFNLETANQLTAAAKARDVYVSLVSVGWDATFDKYKPSPVAKDSVCTLGEFLAAVTATGKVRERTLRIYATKLRKIVSDIARIEAGVKTKARLSKFDYVNGGREAWLTKINGQSMALLTPESISAWRIAYVAKAGTDPVKRNSAERSCASMLRAGRALFRKKLVLELVKHLKVSSPPNPFVGLDLPREAGSRYQRKGKIEKILASAAKELRTEHPQEFLGLNLCFWAGLRRKEADTLTWSQIDFEEGTLAVQRTKYFEPKTAESERVIDLAPEAVELLRGFKRAAKGEFVMEGGAADPGATYGYYRADCTWRRLIEWLKDKGFNDRTAIHSLRKESGSIIVQRYGIEAGRQHLGHRDIRTTSETYTDKRQRVEISLTVGAPGLAVVGDGKTATA